MKLLFVLLLFVSCASTDKSSLNDFQLGCIYGTVGVVPDVDSQKVMHYCNGLQDLHNRSEEYEVHPVPRESGGSLKRIKRSSINM